MGHVWTLCFEEQFYGIAGLLLLLTHKRIFLAALIVTLSIPVIAGLAHRYDVNLDGTIVGGGWYLFAAGIAVYYRIHYAGRFGRWINAALFTVAILLPVFDRKLFTSTDHNGSFTQFVAFLFAFLLAALYPNDTEMTSWRILRPFSFCGRIWYSLYLIHPLVTTGIGHAFYEWGLRGNWQTLLVTVPVSLSLSLAISAAFFFLVERHFLNASHGSPQTPDSRKANERIVEVVMNGRTRV